MPKRMALISALVRRDLGAESFVPVGRPRLRELPSSIETIDTQRGHKPPRTGAVAEPYDGYEGARAVAEPCDAYEGARAVAEPDALFRQKMTQRGTAMPWLLVRPRVSGLVVGYIWINNWNQISLDFS